MTSVDEIICVLGQCLDTFIKNPIGISSIAIFGIISIISIYFIIKRSSIRSRIHWAYPLVFSVLFLITYFAFSMMCHGNLPFCAEHAFMYSVPAAIIGSILFGYVLLPNIYLVLNRAFPSHDLEKLLPSPVPVYISDSGKPFAFSYGGLRRWIVISQGAIDLLTKKELQAVLLHEYGHLANNSSFYKSSSWVYSKIPLLHAFLDGLALDDEEEHNADMFAVRSQRSSRHLNSAKRKFMGYFGC